MKRIIAQNVLANVRLEATTYEDSVTRFRVLSHDVVMFRGVNIDKAFRMYDLHVDKALHTQPEKVMSGVDLENPPETMKTTYGRSARLLGKMKSSNDRPYVIAIQHAENKNYENIHYACVDGTIHGFSKLNLIDAAQPVTKTGWINIYKYSKSGICIHDTKDEAIEHSVNMDHVKDTIQITWEE